MRIVAIKLISLIAATMAAGVSEVQSQFTAADVGNPTIAGSTAPITGGFSLSGAGSDIGGTNDQFHFNYRQYVGDFDVKVRVQSHSGSSVWAKAGLMGRETLGTNSRHASVFATPSLSGTFFASRVTVGGFTTNTGSFPVTYPNTWLRLKRAGATLTGYAGLDGQAWAQLGSITLSAPSNSLYVGMAITSASANDAATARMQDFTDVVGGTVGSVQVPFEPPGPSSRNTGLVLSEIMYHPKPTNDLEFIEIMNAGLIDENLGGYRLSGDVDFTFPNGTVLRAGARLVVARYPAVVQAAYGISGVLGPWTGNGASAPTNALPDDEGTVRLRNRASAVLLEVTYAGANPWPIAADGAGHSLVLTHPSYGEGDHRAWSASDRIGGSPGAAEPVVPEPIRAVVINEFLAHTDDPLRDYIELYNHGNQSVDISGAYLSDDRDTNKFRIPDGTVLEPRDFVVFDQSELNFSLSSGGERIYLVNSNQTRVIDTAVFEAQANGVASGRYPDGAPGFHELITRTPDAANSPLWIRDVVINELMFNPISGEDSDEYVELYNRGAGAVNIGNWRFTDGIDFQIPADTVIASHGYLVIARNQANLLANYPQLNTANTLGDFDGALANGGERVALAMPDYFLVTNNNVVVTQANYIVVDEVTYVDSGRWARWADGGGSSLELIDPNSDHRLAANWADSDETQKSQWTTIVNTGLLDHNYPVEASGALINEIQVMILGAGEALMDDLVARAGTTGPNLVVNPNFNNGLTSWLIQGNHVRSTLEPAGPGNPSQSMRLRATAGGDNGANRVECDLSSALTVNTNATISGRFRWLRGFPIVLMRLHGGALEAVDTLPLPKNLGTPGLVNSRRVLNAGPAIYDVAHAPILPGPGEPVIVTARVSDPDGVASVQLRYRLDPSLTVDPLPMRDDGTGGDAVAGDGLYTATIAGRAVGTNAFRIAATDSAAGTPAATVFPDPALGECLFRWGEPAITGNLGIYRLWMTASNINLWTVRERLSNQAIDGTFVYGNFRVIYNAGARYRGSPFTRNPSSPNGVGVAANYVWSLPDDELLLGTDELNLDSLEPANSSNVRDVTALREVTSFTILEQLDLPFSYQRYVHVVINGVTSASRNIPIYSDSQQPNGEYTTMWFPDGNEGDLYKVDDWFEFDDTPARQGNKSASLENFITPTPEGPIKKQARYRWTWEKKFNRGLNDDYSSLYAAVDALNSPTVIYVQQLEREFELREWLTALAFRHVVGDWDGYGYQRGKNQFCYRPNGGKFWMLMWDLDFALGCNGGHPPTQNLFTVSLGGANASDHMPEVNRMYTNAYTRRIYLQALHQMAEGPLQDESFLPTLDARYRALLANGLTTLTSPYVPSGAAPVISIPAWLQQRRGFITTNSANAVRTSLYTNITFRITSPLSVTSAANLITISGEGSLLIKDIFLNGVAWPVTWTSVTSWTARVTLDFGSNSLRFEGGGLAGNTNTSSQTVVAQYTGPAEPPQGAVVFNEIMFNPLIPDAEYIELFNTSSNVTHDLSGWRLNGVDYTFRAGSFIAPRSYLVLFKNLPAFVTAYGATIPVFDQFDGNLQAGGETITLIQPGATAAQDVVIDKVRYESVLPWPVGTNGISTASSIQLIDTKEDNSRPLNWSTFYVPAVYGAATNFPGATNTGWRRGVYSGSISAPSGTNLVIFLNGAGDVYLDDLVLVLGTTADVGDNVLQNGDFEEPFSPAWSAVGNHTNSVIDTSFSRTGSGSLHVIAAGSGSLSSTVKQIIPSPLTNNTPYTLSYWFYSTANASNLTIRTTPGSLFITGTNVQTQVIPPFSLPPPLITPAVLKPTPGSNNVDTADLLAIPPLWLNELQPNNLAGPLDNAGERDPWIELYNAGTSTLSLDTYYLANNYDTNLTSWSFPSGATIGPGEFKLIWADAEPGETAGTNLHTSFRLNSTTGTVALVRLVDAKPEVMDYLTYAGVGAGFSYGDFPDGQPFNRQVLRDPTPRGTNIARFVNVFINEWLAGNTNQLADPADRQFEDWFELYNAGETAVDLGGFFLTDSTSNDTNQHSQIPMNGQYVIPAGGFLLVWADNEPEQNNPDRPDLHVDFALSKNGDRIILYGPDGRALIDRVDFLVQTDDVAQGRYPDGSLDIDVLSLPTPRSANILGNGNAAPVLATVGTRTATLGQLLSFTIGASDPNAGQTLAYSIVSGAPAGATLDAGSGLFVWHPAFSMAPTTNAVTVRVADNGVPPLTDSETFTLIGLPPPPTIGIDGAQISLGFQTTPGKTYRVEYKNDLGAAEWQRLNNQDYSAGGATSLTVTDQLNQPQRFYRIVQLD